ncbi:hypothetical protein JHJ32_10945 [Parapedobacter sp. ISTM3]|uniref:DUF6266 family protein n=1 Tax=Parapedobacter sp. ISTM3 TaxID=2800130 RepID=UPI0019052BE8|nr:DUF6266 family protein [Parapedobacter sp. ISTM3]MBK1440504.1 hypothetical protein [Parapedobacter sp. ISTM3]
MDLLYDRNVPKKSDKSYGKLAVQQRMRLAMAFLNPLRPVIAESWLSRGRGSKKKAFGQALKKLMQDALEGDYPDQHVVPDRVDISMGILPGLLVREAVHSEQTLEVYFSSKDTPLARATDEVVLVVYNPGRGVAARNTHVCNRNEGYIKVDLPPQLWSAPFHVYLFAHSASKKQYSKSVYIGQLGP